MAEPDPRPDVSDLKTFDVPDPIKPHGSCGVGLLAVIAGVAAAVGFLHVVRAPHFFAVLADKGEFQHNRDRARRYAMELPPAEVLERVLALSEPADRGAFHATLASTGDASHAPAIVAYLAALRSWRADEDADAALKSLATFGAAAVPPLFELLGEGELHGEVDLQVRAHLEADYPPEALAPHVVKIEPLAERGRWHRVLASTKDPAHIDAILAYVASQGSGGRFEEEAESLLAFGKAGTEELKEALYREERSIVNLAAEALRDVNIEFLTGYCQEQLTAYEEGVFSEGGLRWAMQVQMAVEEQASRGGEPIPAEVVAEARQVAARFSQLAFRVKEMLKAMREVPDNEPVDFCFVHGLSAFDPEVAEYCANTLQVRLTPEKLIDVMFRYIAKKDQFMVKEVEIYEAMLRATGEAGGVRIGENLARLLDEAEGDPTQVFWIYKKMGFKVLQDTGSAPVLPILARYAEDPDSYIETTTGPKGREQRDIMFKDEVAAAVRAIEARGE